VTKLYKKVIGVNDLTLQLPVGAYGLVGPNGSGKTTLINLLTGQLRPTIGRAHVFESNPWRSRSVLKRIGLCPATDVLYPNVSAREWVTYQVRLHGFSQANSRRLAETSLEQVGMAENMHRAMGTYSLGMRQRTKIAQAIAHQPDLLILDEPYNGLDPVGRYQMTEMLKEWTGQGRSLLFASHVLHEIEAITSSFLLIYGGRLLASGTAEEMESILADTPQEVSIIGADAMKLIHRLADQPWVKSLQLREEGTHLRVALSDPVQLFDRLAVWINDEQLNVERFQASEGNLTILFESLLRHHRGVST
ncbi:MAG: ABC transporter ATP-binding protein, partial [Pirellulales bacterium]|nr:ABC transporter ATP-binding protein [Pirellulales bacterium]